MGKCKKKKSKALQNNPYPQNNNNHLHQFKAIDIEKDISSSSSLKNRLDACSLLANIYAQNCNINVLIMRKYTAPCILSKLNERMKDTEDIDIQIEAVKASRNLLLSLLLHSNQSSSNHQTIADHIVDETNLMRTVLPQLNSLLLELRCEINSAKTIEDGSCVIETFVDKKEILCEQLLACVINMVANVDSGIELICNYHSYNNINNGSCSSTTTDTISDSDSGKICPNMFENLFLSMISPHVNEALRLLCADAILISTENINNSIEMCSNGAIAELLRLPDVFSSLLKLVETESDFMQSMLTSNSVDAFPSPSLSVRVAGIIFNLAKYTCKNDDLKNFAVREVGVAMDYLYRLLGNFDKDTLSKMTAFSYTKLRVTDEKSPYWHILDSIKSAAETLAIICSYVDEDEDDREDKQESGLIELIRNRCSFASLKSVSQVAYSLLALINTADSRKHLFQSTTQSFNATSEISETLISILNLQGNILTGMCDDQDKVNDGETGEEVLLLQRGFEILQFASSYEESVDLSQRLCRELNKCALSLNILLFRRAASPALDSFFHSGQTQKLVTLICPSLESFNEDKGADMTMGESTRLLEQVQLSSDLLGVLGLGNTNADGTLLFPDELHTRCSKCILECVDALVTDLNGQQVQENDQTEIIQEAEIMKEEVWKEEENNHSQERLGQIAFPLLFALSACTNTFIDLHSSDNTNALATYVMLKSDERLSRALTSFKKFANAESDFSSLEKLKQIETVENLDEFIKYKSR